jgi:hypothetical protein
MEVQFDVNTTKWLFDPNPVPMTEEGILLLRREPKKAPWTFVSANDLPSDYNWMVVAKGAQMIIDDTLVPYDGEVKFTITVKTADGQQHTCPSLRIGTVAAGPPPIIMNDGTKTRARRKRAAAKKKSSAKKSGAKKSSRR